MARVILVWAVLALAAGCRDPGVACGDGYCPEDTVCAVGAGLCVYPWQLDACLGLAEGVDCDLGGRTGVCRGNICLSPRCGDHIAQGDEQCDRDDRRGIDDCLDLGEGYHEAGTLRCTLSCELDRSACGGRCGDAIVQDDLEECDGPLTDDQTCASLGFEAGTLRCGSDCSLDESGCRGRCGDGARNGDEACDGSDFGAASCASHGFHGGNLRCAGDCGTVEIAECVGHCGDSVRNGPEVCDGADLGGLSCAAYGLCGGPLRCEADCVSVDPSACHDCT